MIRKGQRWVSGEDVGRQIQFIQTEALRTAQYPPPIKLATLPSRGALTSIPSDAAKQRGPPTCSPHASGLVCLPLIASPSQLPSTAVPATSHADRPLSTIRPKLSEFFRLLASSVAVQKQHSFPIAASAGVSSSPQHCAPRRFRSRLATIRSCGWFPMADELSTNRLIRRAWQSVLQTILSP
jgi:hypothetical protein